MSTLTLALLGSPRVMVANQAVEVGSRKALALLFYLAVTREPHQRDHLATLLWPLQGQTNARASLRRALWLLNKEGLAGWLSTEQDALRLQGDYWCDVHQFQAHLQADQLLEAVALYRDTFLAGFTLRNCPDFDQWQFLEAQNLQAQLAGALETLVQQQTGQAEYKTALATARRWLALDPLHEAPHRQLMELYARAGQQTAAMRQYQECVRILDEELGVPPDPETVALHDAIRSRKFPPSASVTAEQQPASKEPESHARAQHSPHPPSIPHNLLPASTPFLGREQELADLDALLQEQLTRLITIVGPGGTGKTRLALAVAEQQLQQSHFPHGVYFVPVASISAIEYLLPAIAETFNVPLDSDRQPARGPVEPLFDYLRHKQLLLVLDNCEHLLHGIELLTELLRAAPQVQILATARERLRLLEEQVYTIRGLTYPDEPQALRAERPADLRLYAAYHLFLHSARRARADFVLEPDDYPHLLRICRAVEGMPLALELAASWVTVLPIAQLASAIQNNLDLLASDVRNVPPRQRSMRAVFDATWQRLTAEEQELFACLTVFRGGFTRAAAQAVADASLPMLGKLTNRSLLHYHAAGDRYQIHELLRQYGAEKLAMDPVRAKETRGKHSAYYCQWLAGQESKLKGAQQESAAKTIEADIDNMQMGWQWALHQGEIALLQLAIHSLAYYYEWQGRIEIGQAHFQETAQQLLNQHADQKDAVAVRRLLVNALAWQATFTHLLGDAPTAEQLLQQCLALLAERTLAAENMHAEYALVYAQAGRVATRIRPDEAWALYTESVRLFRRIEWRWETSEVLAELGQWAHVLSDFPQAERYLNESLDIKRALGDSRGSARLLGLLSQLTVETADVERAEELARAAVAIYTQLDNRYGMAQGLRQLGVILLWRGANQEAQSLIEQSLTYCTDLGNRSLLAQAHAVKGLALANLGEFDAGQAAAQIGLSLFREIGDLPQIAWALWVMGWILTGKEEYRAAEAVLQESVTRFRQLASDVQEPRQLGWSLSLLGYVLWRNGEQAQAQQTLLEVLSISRRLRDFLPLITSMVSISLMLAHQGQLEPALELLGLVWRYPLVANARVLRAATCEIEQVTADLPAAATSAAQARGAAADLWQTATALREKLSKLGW